MDWKETLIDEAKTKRMCEENFRGLCACNDKETAIGLYKKTIDWALEENYPTLGTICGHFGDCEERGIFVGKLFSGEEFSEQLVYVFHACTGEINIAMDVDNAVIPMLYFANGCDIKVRCKQKYPYPIKVPVYVFGANDVMVESSQNAIFNVYNKEVKP